MHLELKAYLDEFEAKAQARHEALLSKLITGDSTPQPARPAVVASDGGHTIDATVVAVVPDAFCFTTKAQDVLEVVQDVSPDCIETAPVTCSTECPSRDTTTSTSAFTIDTAPTSAAAIVDVVHVLAAPAASDGTLDGDTISSAAPTPTTCSTGGPVGDDPGTVFLIPRSVAASFTEPPELSRAQLGLDNLVPVACSMKCLVDTNATPSRLLQAAAPAIPHELKVLRPRPWPWLNFKYHSDASYQEEPCSGIRRQPHEVSWFSSGLVLMLFRDVVSPQVSCCEVISMEEYFSCLSGAQLPSWRPPDRATSDAKQPKQAGYSQAMIQETSCVETFPTHAVYLTCLGPEAIHREPVNYKSIQFYPCCIVHAWEDAEFCVHPDSCIGTTCTVEQIWCPVKDLETVQMSNCERVPMEEPFNCLQYVQLQLWPFLEFQLTHAGFFDLVIPILSASVNKPEAAREPLYRSLLSHEAHDQRHVFKLFPLVRINCKDEWSLFTDFRILEWQLFVLVAMRNDTVLWLVSEYVQGSDHLSHKDWTTLEFNNADGDMIWHMQWSSIAFSHECVSLRQTGLLPHDTYVMKHFSSALNFLRKSLRHLQSVQLKLPWPSFSSTCRAVQIMNMSVQWQFLNQEEFRRSGHFDRECSSEQCGDPCALLACLMVQPICSCELIPMEELFSYLQGARLQSWRSTDRITYVAEHAQNCSEAIHTDPVNYKGGQSYPCYMVRQLVGAEYFDLCAAPYDFCLGKFTLERKLENSGSHNSVASSCYPGDKYMVLVQLLTFATMRKVATPWLDFQYARRNMILLLQWCAICVFLEMDPMTGTKCGCLHLISIQAHTPLLDYLEGRHLQLHLNQQPRLAYLEMMDSNTDSLCTPTGHLHDSAHHWIFGISTSVRAGGNLCRYELREHGLTGTNLVETGSVQYQKTEHISRFFSDCLLFKMYKLQQSLMIQLPACLLMWFSLGIKKLSLSDLQPDDYNCLYYLFTIIVHVWRSGMGTSKLGMIWDPEGLLFIAPHLVSAHVQARSPGGKHGMDALKTPTTKKTDIRMEQIENDIFVEHFQGGRDAITVAIFLKQGSVDQKYDIGFDQYCDDADHFISGSFVWAFVDHNYYNLVEAYLDFSYHYDSDQVHKRRVQWDPGGSPLCRLGVKPIFKEGGMLGSYPNQYMGLSRAPAHGPGPMGNHLMPQLQVSGGG